MDEPVGGPRWRVWLPALLGILTVGSVAGLWAAQRWGNSTTPIAIEEVLAEVGTTSTWLPSQGPVTTVGSTMVRASTTTTTVSTQPSEGVYRVASSGSEGIDVLDKPTHVYPAESALVVSRTPCGHRIEWIPLAERREWFEVCVERGGIRLVRYGGFHTFFGQDDERTQVCPDVAWLVPPDEMAADTFTATCAGSGLVDQRTTTVLRRDTVVLDGKTVPVTVVRTTIVGTGSTRGESTRELWFTDGGLPVAWIDDVTGVSDSAVGMVNYREQMELRLVSLVPV